VAQGKFYLSPNAGPSALAGELPPNYFNVAWQNDNLHEAAGAYANSAGHKNTFILAPNYPAGTDALNGYKRFYEGELAGEIYTQLGQTDYAGEIAQIRASGADSVFFFLPGGMGIAFMKQYAESGVDIPVIGPGFSFSQDILAAVGDAALGVRNTRSGRPTSTTRRTWPSSKRSRPNTGGCRRSTPPRASTRRTSPLGHGQGRRVGCRRLPRGAEGGGFRIHAGRFRVRAEPPSDPGHLRPRGGEGGRRHHEPIVGVALEDRGDAFAEQCKM
jgi:branched-chain amino acid transport system substrate-binding protein